MSELLERVRAEIRERLEASRAAVEEYRTLEAALAALGGPGTELRARSGGPAPAAKPSKPASKTRSASAAAGAKRAPRGANRTAVLRVLEERPGVSATELSAASGVGRTVLYPLLSRLVEQGEVVKERLPSGPAGYSLRREGRETAGAPSVIAPATEPGLVIAATAENAEARDGDLELVAEDGGAGQDEGAKLAA